MTVMKPITKEELIYMRKREEEKRYWEGIQRAVEDIYNGVQKYARYGDSYYVYSCHALKDSACRIVRDRLADLFPDSSVAYDEEFDYKANDCNIPNFPTNAGRFIAAIVVDWR